MQVVGGPEPRTLRIAALYQQGRRLPSAPQVNYSCHQRLHAQSSFLLEAGSGLAPEVFWLWAKRDSYFSNLLDEI
jgi:hypothetical protein